MIEMLNEARFSTSTSPWRSKITPRGARSGSVRWWLFSAISRNLACWKTWKNQKPPSEQGEHGEHRHAQHADPRLQAPAILRDRTCWLCILYPYLHYRRHRFTRIRRPAAARAVRAAGVHRPDPDHPDHGVADGLDRHAGERSRGTTATRAACTTP